MHLLATFIIGDPAIPLRPMIREREEDSPTVLTLPKRASSYVQQLNDRPPLTRRIPITTSTKTAGSQQQLSLKTGMQSSPSQTTTTPTNTTPAHSQMNTNNTTTATTAALGEVGRVRRLPTFGTLGRIAPTQQFYQQQQHQWIFSLLSWHAALENVLWRRWRILTCPSPTVQQRMLPIHINNKECTFYLLILLRTNQFAMQFRRFSRWTCAACVDQQCGGDEAKEGGDGGWFGDRCNSSNNNAATQQQQQRSNATAATTTPQRTT